MYWKEVRMTEQADFWRGKFGDEYISRNESDLLLASNLVLFSQIFESHVETPETFLELGANVGMNIRALKLLFPQSKFALALLPIDFVPIPI